MIGVQFDKKDIVRIDKSSALPRFANALLEQFQTTLWTWYGGDLSEDNTGAAPSWAWNFIKVICLVLESAKNYHHLSLHAMRNLDVCRKIYSRVRSSEQNFPWELLGALQNALRFMLAAAKVSRDPADLWNSQYFWIGDSHSPEDFEWLVEYIDPDNQEAVFDILLLLVVIEVRCSPAKRHQFFKSIIACMGSHMPAHLRHAALRLAHSAREEMVSIDTIDNAELRDMILTEFSPAILTAISPQPGITLSDDDPDCFFHEDRDLCYLELLFALARNSNWHPHLFEDRHIDRCISIVAKGNFAEYAFYLAGILLRIAPEQSSVISLNSITGEQWWDMMRDAWLHASFTTDDIHCFEFLPVLVEGTKRYMHIAAQKYISWEIHFKFFIEHVDRVLDALEMRDSQQGEGEGVAVAVKELKTVASDMLEKLVSSQGVVSPLLS
ncbi:uncharacterized protein F5147DRAFT_721288 [Suillus discolor]|uniref:Uncharacterized protein n=1 Tax=Suillus discolor TaxID=1912936 RepID=A0A9P7EWV6_9AGAM|nr:uncharacterized protein F5147DRAFT_721288 [Suillus discolor]KAG2093094.1 hypothetical protein F5147DRAFT_721288 [Suillus discolor]